MRTDLNSRISNHIGFGMEVGGGRDAAIDVLAQFGKKICLHLSALRKDAIECN